MEDELGKSHSGGVSQSPLALSENLQNETFVEKVGSENLVEGGHYEEGDDGEEIMVEIVGSDVFVDGVGGNKEGDLESAEIGGMNGHVLEEKHEPKTEDLPEAMDVLGKGDEKKKEESKLGLPESSDEKELVVTGKNKLEKDKMGSPESRFGKSNIISGENMMVSSEAGLPKSMEEENKVVTEAVGDVPSEVVEGANGESDSISPFSSNEKTFEVTEAMNVCGEGNENGKGESESGLSKPEDEEKLVAKEVPSEGEGNKKGGEKADIFTQDVDCNSGKPEKAEAEVSSVLTDEAILTSQSMTSEDKTVKDEAADEEYGLSGKDDLLSSSVSVSNQDELVSNSVSSHGARKNVDGGQIVQEATVNNIGEGPKNVKVGVIDSVVENSLAPDSRDGQAEFVDGCECLDTESKDLVVKSDVSLASDFQNGNEDCAIDPHGTEFKPTNENEREEAAGKEFEVVLDFNEGGLNINLPDLSCLGNEGESLKPGGGLELDTDHPELEVPNDQRHLADEIDTDMVDQDNSLKVDIQVDTDEYLPSKLEVVNGGELSENTEKIVSEESNQTLDCEENVEIPNAVEQSGLPQSEEHVIIQTSNHSAEKLRSTDSNPNEVFTVAAVPGTAQFCDSAEAARKSERLETDDKNKSGDEENESDGDYHDSMEIDSEFKDELLPSESEKSKSLNEEKLGPTASSPKMKQLGYFSPPENESHKFAVSDLVWGKVRSHPWWPGQIFDPADASEKAVKHYKKDSYLVAYFGDRTFAWNESSLLKPFRPHFSQIEKQSNSGGFQHAVTCALEEVSRRVELSLACTCIPRDKYALIEAQPVENTGIREETSKRHGLDHSSRVSCFEPDKLVEYIRDLAAHASHGADRLDLAIARAQLSAFNCFKGYRPPTVFPSSGDLLKSDAEKVSSEEKIASPKRPHTPKDSSDSKKERSLTELMGGEEYDNNYDDELAGKKRKALDPLTDRYDKGLTIYTAKVSNVTSQTPNKPSFKIGECIRRVASQLTGSGSSGRDETVIDEHQERQGNSVLSVESFSVDEILLQLECVAIEPKRSHNFVNVVHTFFMGFRSSVVLNRRARKKQAEQGAAGGAGEEFEFDDVSDSYWTDRIVQNYSDEQQLQQHLNKRVNGPGSLQGVGASDVEKPTKMGRRSNSRKRFSNNATAASELDERVKRAKQESSPAELILNFSQRNNIPSEINLNKMFRRFGPLMESETEVDHESGCAKVIFKRGCDAEVARDSSERFNIFGQGLVNYQIGYEPLISVRVLPVVVPPALEDVIFMQ